MKLRRFSPKGAERLKSINLIGVVAGVLMIALPFAGPWWRLTVGTGAVDVAFSPFKINMTALGQPIESTLARYVCFGVALTVIIAGIFILLASLLPKRWWSNRLLRFGATKVLWMVVVLLVLVTLMALVVNKFIVAKMPELEGFSMPYISGSTTSTLHVGDATITLPIAVSLAWPFVLAIVTAAFGLAARIYHRRFVKPLKPSKS